MVSELVWTVGAYLGFGVLTALLYAVAWGSCPAFRHVVAWPIVQGCMFWRLPLPARLRPAPREVSYNATLRSLNISTSPTAATRHRSIEL